MKTDSPADRYAEQRRREREGDDRFVADLIMQGAALRVKLVELLDFLEYHDDGMPGLAASMGEQAKDIRKLLGLGDQYDEAEQEAQARRRGLR